MKKICICGCFGFGYNSLNGQTVKTKTVSKELEKKFGRENLVFIDTHNAKIRLPLLLLKVFKAFCYCENIIMLPAHNGVRVFAPLFILYNFLFRRKLHYVVIGGWLPEFVSERKWLAWCLRRFNWIYVETSTMQKGLEAQRFANIKRLPNFKDLKILQDKELVYLTLEPFKLCTFSRVMKEKGIEDAVNAVIAINEEFGRIVFTLDIYGQIDKNQILWFNELQNSFPKYIKYGGLVPFDKSVEIIKNYYALLFPTYYEGEGFAGTLLDAFASGVPVVASDWRYDSEIVTDKKTGLIFKSKDIDDFKKCLRKILQDSTWWNGLKINCISEANEYKPCEAVRVLVKNINE